MEDICNGPFPFYKHLAATDGSIGASVEARLLIALKCLAFGVPPHTFQDYFQMSKPIAASCCYHFNLVINQLYKEEFLRIPTPADLRSIVALHKKKYGGDGMFGCLDCMHTYWKNCPKAWA